MLSLPTCKIYSRLALNIYTDVEHVSRGRSWKDLPIITYCDEQVCQVEVVRCSFCLDNIEGGLYLA